MVFSKDIFSAIYMEYIKGFVPIRYRGYCLCISRTYLQARVFQQKFFTISQQILSTPMKFISDPFYYGPTPPSVATAAHNVCL
jgi:hypothetical protein